MFDTLFLMDETYQRRIEAARQRAIARRTAAAVDWTPDLKWQPELNLKAASWPNWSLFPVQPAPGLTPTRKLTPDQCVDHGVFRYVERVLPRGHALLTASGNRRGTVMFDTDLVIPCLYDVRRGDINPWMSITPLEVLTLRAGTRHAYGHTVIAGLGLGWQLAQVLVKPKVTQVTLVERSPELIDWILPRVLAKVGPHHAQVDAVIGNAYDVVPKLHADVALIDIYPGYGGNTFVDCPNIERVWCWGSARRGGA